jgi:hypothetical protein
MKIVQSISVIYDVRSLRAALLGDFDRSKPYCLADSLLQEELQDRVGIIAGNRYTRNSVRSDQSVAIAQTSTTARYDMSPHQINLQLTEILRD